VSKRRVAILGSTGSVGRQALAILAEHGDRFEVVALQAHRSAAELAQQAARFRPGAVCLTAGDAPPAGLPPASRCHLGADGLLTALAAAEPDLVLNAITGAAGLAASEWALQHGLLLALANKESLVVAGEYLVPLAARTGATILPVDSEHCAIHQCLRGERRDVRCVPLTDPASVPATTARDVRHDHAAGSVAAPHLEHGPITVDSAMMNKALE
jgi:1-deoxy-D-xylulose-5-phosphate reductoisomerase